MAVSTCSDSRCATPDRDGPSSCACGTRAQALPADLGRDAVALGHDAPALGYGDGPAVAVADDVALTAPPAGDDAREQRRGDMAERRGVVLAGQDHEPLVAGGERGVDAPRMVGGDEDRRAQRGVPATGRAAVAAAHPGGVERGHEPAEGAHAGEGAEAVGIAEAGEDLGTGEQVFGWMKTVGGGRKLRFVGRERNRGWLELTAAAYNLVRLARIETAAA